MRRFALVLVLTALAGVAHADEKATCVAAYKQAQVRRKAGALRDAREQLLVCSRETCPAVIKADCGPWLGEVSRAIASIVLEAVDPEGAPLAEVEVQIDGQTLSARPDGRAIEVDPGAHVLRFSTAGAPPVEQRVELADGERDHRVHVVLAPRGVAATTTSRPVPASAIALGGVGVLGGVGFAVFGLLGNGQKSDLDMEMCKPNCPSSQVGTAERDYVLADVSLGVGLLSLGLATYFFVTRPTRTSYGTSFDVRSTRGGMVVTRSVSW